MSPQRIQLRRTKGWRKPEGVVVVSRPSKWNNPFAVAAFGRAESVALYARLIETGDVMVANPKPQAPASTETVWAVWRVTSEQLRRELGGRDLACWCPLDQPCHADVLLRIANTDTP